MTTTAGRESRAALTLGALGVVYGDIGTSPLYTMKEVFRPEHRLPLDAPHLIGAVSVILWGLMFIVTLKYVILILRADNRGEGGIMALTALAAAAAGSTARRRLALLLVGVVGAALFYGDSIITPAISVLSAVEGLEVATPAFKPYVLPISLGVLVGLFAVQRFGTGLVGRLFGPLIALWFLALGAAGLVQIRQQPAILAALNPWHAIGFLQEQGWAAFTILGAIVLAFTGAEALYADLGHFGRRPIQIAWVGLVLPALALNYMGQGALLLRSPEALENPFYHLLSADLLLPAVVLATTATVIASQAVITGAYSLTQQAIQLGLPPRMQMLYTSARERGQIYLPLVNWLLLGAVVLAVVAFGSSSALASAYGIAVTITMFTTTLLTYFVVRHAWRYPLPIALGATGVFLVADLVLVVACALKFLAGGWFPLVLGLVLFTVMTSWRRGRELLRGSIVHRDPELASFLQALPAADLRRAKRTAIYPVGSPETVPQALLHNLKHNQVLHDHNVILTVVFGDEPWVPEADRVSVHAIGPGFWRVQVTYGFKDKPDIPRALLLCAAADLHINLFETSYFLSRETVIPTRRPGMALWRERLFAFMARNATSIADFLRLPSNCVIELGTRVRI
ncbi:MULTISPECIES: potassium transporter Kup [Ramlibacter]|uniref:Probable potassium transport system protein Kup n=1 Tax=Ramlibacter pinisoli TaxID=2682844 RepID=A0A6N8J002_9BURK|nr:MULTISPECIES: potassium transporter Kup [Ramlibacter]MBA2961657.1 potassium transporter Kup [Ramlibacter sp. CGMCC 1.13660]MVQ31600.1 potassium transporter Kup [Ramlibacter pinisoli]